MCLPLHLITVCPPPTDLTSYRWARVVHPGVELTANLKSISYRCHLIEVAFALELTEETIYLHLGCLQGGDLSSYRWARVVVPRAVSAVRPRLI